MPEPLHESYASKTKTPQRMGFRQLPAIIISISWFLLVSSWCARIHPLFELACHFSWHTFLALVAVAVFVGFSWTLGIVRRQNAPVSLFSKQVAAFVWWAIPFGFFLYLCEPWKVYGPQEFSKHDTPIAGKSLRILSWNIWLNNPRLESVLEEIEAVDADIVFLFETQTAADVKLDVLRRKYPYYLWETSWESGFFAAMSRIPGSIVEKETSGINAEWNWAKIVIPPTSAGTECVLLGIHPLSPSPWEPERTTLRDREFQAISHWVTQQTLPTVVLGDFNVTPWSPVFRQFRRNSKLRDSRDGFGLQASWPSIFGSFGIPIDHALLTRQWTVHNRQVLPRSPGSDHRPILIEISLSN